MAPHSSTLAWKIPWTEEPGGLQFMGLQSRTWLSAHTVEHALLLFSHVHLPEFAQSRWWWVNMMPSNHLIVCHSLLPSMFPSIRVFSTELSLCIRWPKYWSFSFSIHPSMNNQGWCPLGLTGWISLQSKGLSRAFSNTTVQKHQFFGPQLSV